MSEYLVLLELQHACLRTVEIELLGVALGGSVVKRTLRGDLESVLQGGKSERRAIPEAGGDARSSPDTSFLASAVDRTTWSVLLSVIVV